MRKLARAVWIYAFAYNVYGTWVLGRGLIRIFTEVGLPNSLGELRIDAEMAGPIITLIAMLWSLSWRPRQGWNPVVKPA